MASNSVEIDGRNFRSVRESLGYGQREFGALVGVTEKRVQQIEGSERVGVYRRTLRKIGEITKRDVSSVIQLLTPVNMDFAVIGEPGEEDLWGDLRRVLAKLAVAHGTDIPNMIKMIYKEGIPDAPNPLRSPSEGRHASPPPKPAPSPSRKPREVRRPAQRNQSK